MHIKEDRVEVTLGNLIKIPPNLLLDLSSITFTNHVTALIQDQYLELL